MDERHDPQTTEPSESAGCETEKKTEEVRGMTKRGEVRRGHRTVAGSELAPRRGYPRSLLCDNGPELTGRDLDRWASAHGVTIQFIQPGKPSQNVFIESFNDKFRSEMLGMNWFSDLDDARRKIANWVREYNEERPHSSLGRIPPAIFARRAAALRSPTAPSELLPAPVIQELKAEETVRLSLDH